MLDSTEKELFPSICAWLIDDIEGGEVNDPHDRGGHTHYGITARLAAHYGHDDVGALSHDDAVVIYHTEFWQRLHGDALPPRVAAVLFDGAVNHGLGLVVRMLQRIVGATPDGMLGPRSRAAVARANRDEVVHQLLVRRARLYHDICQKDSTQARFLNGWFSRLFKLQRFTERTLP